MPKKVDHDQMRKEILDGCFNLFSQKGYDKVTIREIARSLKMSPGMLYHYFPTKQAIFESLFAYKRVDDIDELSREMGREPDRERIIALFMKRWKNNRELYQNLMMLAVDYFRASGCEKNLEVFTSFSDFYSGSISSYFGIEEEMGRFIVIYLMGLFYHHLLTPGAVDINRQLSIFRKLLDLPEEKEEAMNEQTGRTA